MIIKSMSGSNMSFGTLYSYLTRDDEFELYSHNLYSNPYDKEEVIKEFIKNASFIRNSRGKNYLYHEILSIKENENLSLNKQKEILRDIANEYINQRAKENLILQAIHTDKQHTHIHLMISANEINSNKRQRLSKQEFATIQKNIEEYQNSKYPYLQSHHYKDKKNQSKEKRNEQELKYKQQKLSQKDKLREILKQQFEKSTSKIQLHNSLKNLDIEFYIRGKNIGVIFEGKQYRLNTLNLQDEYKSKLREYELKEAREMKQEEYKEAKKSQNNQQSRKEQLNKDRSYQTKSNEKSKSNSRER